MISNVSRSIVRMLLRRIHAGSLTVIEGDDVRTYGAGQPAAVVEVHAPRVWRMLLSGSRGMADAYAQGLWDSHDLAGVIRVAARNTWVRARGPLAWARRAMHWLLTLVRPATRGRSRRDIAAHYDLGNELFSRMLDPTMMYSCAVFEDEGMSLSQAQVAKLERICRRLAISPSDNVLEIGTGWGAFALYAAATRGCRVTTTTISREQHAFAVERVREAGLEDRVTVLMRDYRDLDGRFDKLVSIEMIEAVGARQFGTFFRTCSDLLEPHGAMLIQAITVDDRLYRLERGATSFIKSRIFPGGCLPSVEVMTREVARRTDMQVVGLDDITAHYVRTLREWRRRFTASAEELDALGYDEQFRRLWTLYLAYCEGGFAERRIGDVHLLLAKPRCDVASLGVDAPRPRLEVVAA